MPVGADVVAATTMVLPRGVKAICELVDMFVFQGYLAACAALHYFKVKNLQICVAFSVQIQRSLRSV